MVKRAIIKGLLILLGLTGIGESNSIYGSTEQVMPLAIQAPPDTTINVTMPGCRAMVILDMATVISFDPNCIPIDFNVFIPGVDTLTGNGGKATFKGTGTYDVYYEARYQICPDSSRDTMQVVVIDSIPPTAVCTGTKTVSLDGNGMAILPAFVFDGGSTDSCFLYYKVRRTSPPVGYDCTTPDNPNYMFDDEVKFCCEDLNDTIMVILRVYDTIPPAGPVGDDVLRGRYSDCETEVIIRDKAPPVLTCPPDITIECGDHIDFDTLGLPTVVDNCDSITFDVSIVNDIDQCGVGEFRRVIIGTDGGGQTDTCIQTIFVVNNEPFDGNDTNDLKWPEAYVTIYDCIFVPDTAMAGGPVVIDDECSMVSISWTDEVYTFSRGACSKVIRTFKVLDWCQYDPKINSACTPDNGCWTFEQVIKVVDTIPPTIMRPNDTIVPYLKPGCTDLLVRLDSATADTCFFGEEITFEIQIDFFADGNIDHTISGPDATFVYPVGKHFVIYSATDECGNTSFDTMKLEVKDRVLPTPIAKSGISIGLTDMGGGMVMTSVWAIDLNASSYDNCTNQRDLVYSFSPDTTDKERVFDCDSIGVRAVRLYVTDECGNQDFVTTNVLVDDTGGHCPTNVRMSSISGLVRRHDGMKLHDVDIALSNTSKKQMTQTDDQGKYMHDDLERSLSYELVPDADDDPMKGITTRDVVLIQRHLLGLEEFEDTYQYLAADVNNTGHVSTGDIINLRKLILGIESEYQHGKEWLFIPESWTFTNPKDPWMSPWPGSFTLNNLQDPEVVNFKGYKIGDIDMSYKGLYDNGKRELITSHFDVRFDEASEALIINNSSEQWIAGMQMALKLIGFDGDQLVITSTLDNWSEANYRYDPLTNILLISWNSLETQWFPEDDFLNIQSDKKGNKAFTAVLENDRLVPELYTDDLRVSQIELSRGEESTEDGLTSISVTPNPFGESFTLEFFSQEEMVVTTRIVDVLGKPVATKEINASEGWYRSEFSADELDKPGVYILQVVTADVRKDIRLVKSR